MPLNGHDGKFRGGGRYCSVRFDCTFVSEEQFAHLCQTIQQPVCFTSHDNGSKVRYQGILVDKLTER